jgi:hypothetical protein
MEIESGTGSWAFSVLGRVVAQLPDILKDFHREQVRSEHVEDNLGCEHYVEFTF